jgi:hypothetical protein
VGGGMGGWVGGGMGFEFARRMREKVRGEYRFSSLMKQKIKGKNCAVFCFAGKRKILFIYL